MKKTICFIIGLAFLAGSCGIDQSDNGTGNRHLVMATLYHQNAAEMRALTYQAYNMARLRLDVENRLNVGDRELAVVVDIDETVLDNSPYQAESILEDFTYPQRWDEWVNKAEARAVPGSLEFLQYADMIGSAIFYVTNRKDKFKQATINNLRDLGFPQATQERLLMRTGESTKEPRREKIQENYKIAVLIGDNLNDFLTVFEEASIEERYTRVDSMRNDFGKRFIMLPNAMYGEWEGAFYNYDYAISERKKSNRRIEHLEGF